MECARASASRTESLPWNLVNWHVNHANYANHANAKLGQVDLVLIWLCFCRVSSQSGKHCGPSYWWYSLCSESWHRRRDPILIIWSLLYWKTTLNVTCNMKMRYKWVMSNLSRVCSGREKEGLIIPLYTFVIPLPLLGMPLLIRALLALNFPHFTTACAPSSAVTCSACQSWTAPSSETVFSGSSFAWVVSLTWAFRQLGAGIAVLGGGVNLT